MTWSVTLAWKVELTDTAKELWSFLVYGGIEGVAYPAD
jgi:hypothetical protein